MIGGLKESLWRDWGHNILPWCRWVNFFFFRKVSRQWRERFVWIFSSAFPSLIWDQLGCSLKSWFPRLLMSCRWLSKPSCDHSSVSVTYLPTPRWKFWNLFGWFMYAKYDRYILGLYLGSKDGPACFKHEPTQIAIKTFRVANGDGVCRPLQRSLKHCESLTNEQL